MSKIKAPSPMEKAALLGKDLADSYARWNARYNGESSFDPFYADGYNLNLIRRQISIIKKQIEKELPEELYPQEYQIPLPALMDNEYIALQDQWVKRGEKRILEIMQMPDYLALIHSGYPKKVGPKEDDKNHIYYYTVIGYVKNLERSIREAKEYEESGKEMRYMHTNPYLDLRRYASYKDSWWHDAFSRCVTLIQKQFPELLQEKNISTKTKNPVFTVQNEEPPIDSIIPIQKSAAASLSKLPKNRRERNQLQGQFSLFDFGLM